MSDKVTMPMTSAGIIGFSPDTKLSGFQISPKAVVIATFILVIVVKTGDILISLYLC